MFQNDNFTYSFMGTGQEEMQHNQIICSYISVSTPAFLTKQV